MAFKEITIDEGVPDLIGVVNSMPQVSPDLLGSQGVTPKRVDKVVSGATDRKGKTFDPEYHKTDETGNPVLTKDGYCKIDFKKRYKKTVEQPKINIPEDLNESANRRITAEASAGLYIQFGVGVFGDEWYPEKSKVFNEQEHLVLCFDNYYRVKGVKDIPPGVALAIGLSGYALKRFTKPNTKTKLQRIGGWIGEKIKKVRKNGSFSNTRNHGERKDNPSGQAS